MYKKLNQLKPYLLLLLILLIAYLPLATFYFGMKNDAFSDNFPDKFFLSESLHAGMMPLWNPYMNFGFPVYADPGFALWNPVTWLFAFAGYTAYSLTVEVLFYIYLAGIFMFRLGRFLKFTPTTNLTVAAMYMCSGFFVGSLQYINFLTSAAFIPLLIQAYLQLFQKPNYKKSFLLAISGYFIFAGGHPAIPFATVYFLIILSAVLVLFFKAYRTNYKQITFFLCLSLILFVLLASPALYSYLNLLESYSKNMSQQNLSYITNVGFTPVSYISFLFPFSTAVRQTVFTNDVAVRNGFMSTVGIIASVCALIHKNKTSLVFLISGLLMLILCMGGDFKIFLYEKLPLLNYIRTNGEFRVFPIVCFCISAGISLDQLINSDHFYHYFLKILKSILAIMILMFVILFFITATDFHIVSSQVSFIPGITTKIKWLLDNGSFHLFLLCSVFLSIIVLSAVVYFLNKRKYSYVSFCIIADLIINAILYLPVTGIGQVTLSQIQNIYNSANPGGIPIPPLIPINKIDTLDVKTTGLVGDITYYNKKIGTQRLTDYPSYLKTTDSFFSSSISKSIFQMPYVFLKSNFNRGKNNSNIAVNKFTPTHIQLSVNSSMRDTLVFLQNYYKYWKAFNNNISVPVQKSYITFMSVPLNVGDNEIDFYYKDNWLFLFIAIGLSTLIINIALLFPFYKTVQEQ
jgi:hypothetical protein